MHISIGCPSSDRFSDVCPLLMCNVHPLLDSCSRSLGRVDEWQSRGAEAQVPGGMEQNKVQSARRMWPDC